jgi:hypothetical protein
MRNIYHDSQFIHPLHHLIAKGAEASVCISLVVGRITDMIVFRVAKCDIPDAPLIQHIKIPEISLDWRTIFKTHRKRDQPLFEVWLLLQQGSWLRQTFLDGLHTAFQQSQ